MARVLAGNAGAGRPGAGGLRSHSTRAVPSWSGACTASSRAGCTSRGSPRSTPRTTSILADLTDRIQVFDRDGTLPPRLADARVQRRRAQRPDRRPLRPAAGGRHAFLPRAGLFARRASCCSRSATACRARRPGRFGYPTDVVIDRAGNFYVAEYGENDRIQVFSPEGKWLRQWGGHGYEPGEFLKPRALAIDENDRLFVADSCNHRIQVFDTQGKLLEFLGLAGRRARADELSLRPGDRAGPLPLRLRVRQPPRPEVHARRQARWASGARRAAGPGSSTTPRPWPSTAGATSRSIDSNNHRVQRFRM